MWLSDLPFWESQGNVIELLSSYDIPVYTYFPQAKKPQHADVMAITKKKQKCPVGVILCQWVTGLRSQRGQLWGHLKGLDPWSKCPNHKHSTPL